MQNYVSLNIDYVNFNRGGSGIGVRGDGGLGGGLSLGLVGGEKGEKGEKNIKIEYASTSQFLSCNFNDIWIIFNDTHK